MILDPFPVGGSNSNPALVFGSGDQIYTNMMSSTLTRFFRRKIAPETPQDRLYIMIHLFTPNVS